MDILIIGDQMKMSCFAMFVSALRMICLFATFDLLFLFFMLFPCACAMLLCI